MPSIYICPCCGQDYKVNCDGSWKDFFRFDVEGNFWQLISFAIKFLVVGAGFVFITAFTLYNIFFVSSYRDEFVNILCK